MQGRICYLEGGSVGGQIFNNSLCVRRQHAPIIPDLGIKPEKKLTLLGWAYGPF